MEIRSAKYNADGTIDCEIDHPDFGRIPFTASPDDVEPHGREIFDIARGMKPAPADTTE